MSLQTPPQPGLPPHQISATSQTNQGSGVVTSSVGYQILGQQTSESSLKGVKRSSASYVHHSGKYHHGHPVASTATVSPTLQSSGDDDIYSTSAMHTFDVQQSQAHGANTSIPNRAARYGSTPKGYDEVFDPNPRAEPCRPASTQQDSMPQSPAESNKYHRCNASFREGNIQQRREPKRNPSTSHRSYSRPDNDRYRSTHPMYSATSGSHQTMRSEEGPSESNNKRGRRVFF